MKFNEIIAAFLDWYCPADYAGDVETLAGYIAKYPERIKPWEYARAVRILKYAERRGIELYAIPLY